ncbi:hypothetical protein FSP39_008387 [Pinctada imbricata]|uniref:Lysosomal-trafficking regulator n=1 Tax=Pinctada imbricata TaxID=66713 RepID=A0AA88XZ56_PINIB|nr:hypothetical protein FSP39_008387 [Pinctada imbricata]
MRSIVNQLCQEFMSDIVRVTSSADDDDDITTLQQYLLSDRGWLLLHAINRNGLQGLTVGKDFSNLLVSLLPWCLKFTPSKSDNEIGTEELQSVNTSFYHLQKSPKWKKLNKLRQRAIPNVNHRERDDRDSSGWTSNKKLTKVPRHENQESSNSEAEIEEEKLFARSQQEFRRLLFSRDQHLAEVTARHLFNLVLDGSQSLREELFFRVYMFAFESFLGKLSLPNDSLLGKDGSDCDWFSTKVKVHCLSALPHLIQVDSVLHAFLTRRGVGQICSLMDDEKMRAPVLKVFEALVLIDERRLKDTESSLDPKAFKSGMVIRAFVDGLKKKSADETLGTGKDAVDSGKNISFSSEEQLKEDSSVHDLSIMVDMWESCAKICLRSEELVLFLEKSHCLALAEDTILRILKEILKSSSCQEECKDLSDDSGQELDHVVVVKGNRSSACFLKMALLQAMLVICNACYRRSKKGNSKMWTKIMESFHQCSKISTPKLKTLFDVLLNAAMPKKAAILEATKNNTLYQMFIKDDNIDDDEVQQLLQMSSEEEGEAVFSVERGYDADLESQPDEYVNCRNLDNTQEREHFAALFRLSVDLLIRVHRTSSGKELTAQVLGKLLQTLRSDRKAATIVCNEGLLWTILDGFWDELISDGGEQVKSYLLSLIQLLGQQRLTARELQKILQLFQYSSISHDLLLSMLLSVVETSQIKPYHSLKFPARVLLPKSPSSTRSSSPPPTPNSYSTESVSSHVVAPALKNMLSGLIAPYIDVLKNQEVKQIHFEQEVRRLSAVQIPLKKGFHWPPVKHGFTVALWVKISEDMTMLKSRCKSRTGNCVYTSSSEDLAVKDSMHLCKGAKSIQITDCVHIFSVGDEDKMLEVWCGVQTGHILFRLTSATRKEGLVIKEAVSKEVFTTTKWQHLVVTYKEDVEQADENDNQQKNVLCGMITLTLDGWLTEEVILEQSIESPKVEESEEGSILCLGHVYKELSDTLLSYTWYLGSLMVFKGCEITKEQSFHLCALGPTHTSLSKCDTADIPWIYSPLLTKNLVQHSKMPLDVLVGEKTIDMDNLRVNLLVSYCPSSSYEAYYYDLATRQELPALIAGNLGLPQPQNILLSQFPMMDDVRVLASLEKQTCYGLEKAVTEAGGIEALLFLVAKIVEFNKHEDMKMFKEQESLQAKAVQVLLSFVNHSPLLAQDYMVANGNILLSKVLTSNRCTVGYHTLKVIMDASTTESMFRYDPESEVLVMRRKSEAMIRNVSLISELLLNWRVWERAPEGVLDLMFKALASLIREDHPHQAFNIKQYQSAGIINKLFSAYKERIQDGLSSFPVDISQSVVSIVKSMMGQPPDVHMIVEICDFLLFIHPATNSFINHSKSSFYFSLGFSESAQKKRSSASFTIHKVQKPLTSTPHKTSVGGMTRSDSGSTIDSEKSTKRSLSYTPEQQTGKREDKPRSDSFPPVKELYDDGTKFEIGTDVSRLVQSSSPSEKGDNSDTSKTLESTGHLDKGGINGENKKLNRSSNSEENMRSDSSNSAGKFETVSDLEKSHNSEDSSSKSPALSDLESKPDSLIATFKVSQEFLNQEMMTQSVSSYHNSEESLEEEGIYAPKEEVEFDQNSEESETERGLIAVGVGKYMCLLNLLADILLNMPDSLVQKVFSKVIKPDILIILTHNNSPQIRTAILRLLNHYLARASEDHVEDFLKKDSLYLLGAQLYQYPTHTEQMEEVLSLLLGHVFSFESTFNLDMRSRSEFSHLQQSAVPLFLSVLEKTVWDIALCHNSITIVQELFETIPLIGSLMLENGLMEVLCNMIVKINHCSGRSTDIVGQEEHHICLRDIQTLVSVIERREFSASGSHHLQQFEDFLDLLRYAEIQETKFFEISSSQIQNMKAVQFSAILSQLHYVENASQEEGVRLTRQKSAYAGAQAGNNSYGTGFIREHYSYSNLTSIPRHLTNPRMHLTSSLEMVPQFKKLPVYIDPSGDDGNLSGDSDSSRSSSSLHLSNQPLMRALSTDQLPQKPAKSGFSISSMLTTLTRKKRLSVFPVSQSEMTDRFKKVMTYAVDVLIFSDKGEIPKTEEKRKISLQFDKPLSNSIETTYGKQLFDFLFRAYELTLSQDRMLPTKQKNQVMWAVKDTTRSQLGRLLVYSLSNRCEFEDRTYVISYLLGELRGREILKNILRASSEQGQELAFNLVELMVMWNESFNSQQWEDAHKVLNFIKAENIPVTSPSKLMKEGMVKIQEEKKTLQLKLCRSRDTWNMKKSRNMERIQQKYDKLCQHLSSQAMDMTQTVTRLQALERNKFVEHIKRSMTEKIQVKKMWQLIVQNLTHDRAVWYDPDSYPQSWQLDPTEGPGRVRKRLKRCHLGIEKRFLMKGYQDKLDKESADPPLIYLFEDDHQMSDSAALIYQLYKNEKIQHTCRCTAVSPFNESKGELLVGENSIFFVADEAISDANYTQVLLGNKDQLSMTWPFEDVREVHKRWFQLRDIGIEIFLTSGKTCLLACQNKKDRDFLYLHVTALELPNFMETLDLEEVQRSWIEGQISNFDYLTHLNKITGRSFNDLMQYPIFPFILKDYFSDKLDLQNADSFRNLAKPMSVQDRSKEQKYIDNYNILKREYEQLGSGEPSALRVEPYHYGSHYSNSGTVLHFLVRLPPYTKMFTSYQDNNFDIPDRTFHSVQTSWRLASFESATDVKELIPEFFFLPEFLQNFEKFNFGRRQNGEIVSDVNLPPWCRGNPRLFILVLRQALESDYVTKNLHQWIDLVFGYKQQGEAAVRAINVFHPSTYFGMDVDSVKDPLRRHALRTMIKTYGQTPKQLFKQPHPQKGNFSEGSAPNILSQLFLTGSYNPGHGLESTNLSYVPSPLSEVSGLKWGLYVGSHDRHPPEIIWQRGYSAVVSGLVALPTGDVFGVGEKSCCLTMHSKQKVATVYNSTEVIWAAILDWKRNDGILRINNHKDKPVINFLHHNPFEQIVCCASVPDCRLLFVGGTSGTITIYQTVYNQAKESHIQIKGGKKLLHGHDAQINCIEVCKQYSIVVSGSEDNTCIIWDLNRLCLVNSILSHKSGVKAVAVSPTLGDIASVSDMGAGSCLWLHTVNAQPVATLWSTWDLQVLRDLRADTMIHKPVISLTFSHDSQRLYMSSSDGTISMWESPPFGKQRPNNVIVYL